MPDSAAELRSFRSSRSVARQRRIPDKQLARPRSKEFRETLALLEWAGERLLALRISNPYPASYRVVWPEFARNPREAYGYGSTRVRPAIPDARAIDTMDKILAWILLIPSPRHRRVVQLRSLINPTTQRHKYTWAQIAADPHVCSAPLSARRWHSEGINILVAKIPQEMRLVLLDEIVH